METLIKLITFKVTLDLGLQVVGIVLGVVSLVALFIIAVVGYFRKR